MNWRAFRNALLAKHLDSPQKQAEIEQACAAAEQALQLFARLGHHYHLAAGQAEPAADWPQLLFHVDAAPNGRMVMNEYEATELGPGWYETLNAAQHAGAVAVQYAGRGGVFKKNLPQVTDVPSESPLNVSAQLIAKFKQDRAEAAMPSEKPGPELPPEEFLQNEDRDTDTAPAPPALDGFQLNEE